jgi:hypothetical protein
MINDGINDVPDKTIAVFKFPRNKDSNLNNERINSLIKKSEKKRDWFTPHFYRCLPLTIGNQYGFTISLEYDLIIEWNGGDQPEDIRLSFLCDQEFLDNSIPRTVSNFGFGIVTIDPPIGLRTPPGVNLMTINPPNHIIPGITVMTGVVESDNLRHNFTFNIKVQYPNNPVHIKAGTPIVGFIPIPRYFADEFKLEFAEDLFDKQVLEEEYLACLDFATYRDNVEPTLKNHVNKIYMSGKDIYGNSFKDHQKP